VSATAEQAPLPRLNRYIPHPPTEKQHLGLLLPQREVLYGGAAGGGKSDWLLMGALEYADVPGYSALLLRRTFKELELEGGLLQRAWEWLGSTDARPHDGGMRWTFGDQREGRRAVLQFGYLDHPHDHERYQGSAWQFVGFDELTHFRELQYRYLFSRTRRPDLNVETPAWRRDVIEGLSRIPLRMRGASNPGGPGHDWVQQRFGIYRPEGDPDPRRLCHRSDWIDATSRVFLPATIRDNPHIDYDSYVAQLAELDATTRRQLLLGDWDAREPGELFRREWFRVVDRADPDLELVRYWDLAATEASDSNTDPDWTAGLLLGRKPAGGWQVVDVQHFRRRPEGIEARVKAVASMDGPEVPVWIEQEPGASGKIVIAHYQRDVLPGYEVRGNAPADSKGIRARPVASKCEAGLVELVRGRWLGGFLDELEGFPEGHDDQVDALSGAFSKLSAEPGPPEEGPTVWS
jgi:predicted phage terminase large subunit-like protein